MRNENCDRKSKCDDYKHNHCDGCGGNKPTSDLISREALKEAFRERTGDTDTLVYAHTIYSLIDNAPTVEIPVARWDCYCEGQKVGYEKALSERPQGEFSIKELEGWLTSCGYASGTVEDKIKEFQRYTERAREE